MKEMLEEYIQTRISTPIESVLLKESLDENMITQINNLNDEALFFIVNNLYVNPTKVINGEILANKLTTILGMPKENLLSSFVIKKRRHLEILRKMSIVSRDTIKKRIDSEKAVLATISNKENAREIWIQENAIFPFFKIEDNLVRYYPEGEALGQITGFVDNE